MPDNNRMQITQEELDRINNLPEKEFTIGGEKRRTKYDEAASRVYYLNPDGTLSGKSALVKREALPSEEDLRRQNGDNDEDRDVDDDSDEYDEDDDSTDEAALKKKKVIFIAVAATLIIAGTVFLVTKLFPSQDAAPLPATTPTTEVSDTTPIPSGTETSEGVNEIEVIQVIVDLIPGDVITDDNIQCTAINHETYNQISVISDVYKWAEKEDLLGKYINTYVASGRYLSLDDVSSVINPPQNPWINEEFGMKYISIPIDINEFKDNSVNFGTIIDLSIKRTTVNETTSEATDDDAEDTHPAEIEGLQHQTTVQQSVIIDSYQISGLIVCDILNDDGDSIFSQLSAYMEIPAGKQSSYLRQAFLNDSDLRDTLVPAYIRVKVTDAQAEALGNLEENNLSIAFTFHDELDTPNEEKRDFSTKAFALFETIDEAAAIAEAEEGDE